MATLQEQVSMLTADDPALRLATARTLGTQRTQAKEALPAMRERLPHENDPDVRRELLLAMCDIEDDPQTVALEFLAPRITDRDPRVSDAATAWLAKNAQRLTADTRRAVANQIPTDFDASPGTKAALSQFQKYVREDQLRPWLDVLRNAADLDDARKIDALRELADLRHTAALRPVVQEWVKWIARGHTALVDAALLTLRTCASAVQPLIELLGQDPASDDSIRDAVLKKNCPERHLDFFQKLVANASIKASTDQKQMLESWALAMLHESEELREVSLVARFKRWDNLRLAREILARLVTREERERQRRVKVRIVRLLAEMSDPKTFLAPPAESEAAKLDAKLEADRKAMDYQLKYFALPALVRRLYHEEDVETRSAMVETLANVGGPEAIKVLADSVISTERIQAQRRELLNRYYLEPSKARSEEAAQILHQVVGEAQDTLGLMRWMNGGICLVGIALIAVGVYAALFMENAWPRFTGLLASIGGIAGVTVQLVKNPLDRIQTAMAKLVQVETAFTSFIWQLNLNGTYIQSQYVAEGILTDQEIAQSMQRIENAMKLTMNMVAAHAQESRPRVMTRITGISPASVPAGGVLTVTGQHLRGENHDAKGNPGMIALNHRPVECKDVKWTDETIKLRLPSPLPSLPAADGAETALWLSLFVDGMETNALPFLATQKAAAPPESAEEDDAPEETDETAGGDAEPGTA